MSIAANFRRKMDVVLNSADASRDLGIGNDARRAALQRALDHNDLMLVEKDYVQALSNRISELTK